jgi:hypothetical protein
MRDVIYRDDIENQALKNRSFFSPIYSLILLQIIIFYGHGLGQDVYVEGGTGIDSLIVKNSISIEGPLVLTPRYFIFFPTVVAIDPDFGSHLLISFSSPNSELRLIDGKEVGQIILIETGLDSQTWKIFDDPSPGGNIDLSSNHFFSYGDLIQLIWNGTNWLEIDFRDN